MINNKFLVTTGGNVGINTTSPGEKLTVNGNIESLDTIILKNSGGHKWQQLFQNTNDFVIRYNNTSTWSEKLRIASSGNVGIGVTSPGSRRLNIYTNVSGNDVGFESTISRTSGSNYSVRGLANGSGATVNIGGFFEATGASINTALWAYNGRVLLATQNATDYVGIGTSSPTQKLHLNNSAALTATYQKFTNGTATTGTTLGIDADGDFLINNGEAKEIKLYTNDTQRLTINSAGLVAINTTPQFGRELLVKGEISATNAKVFSGILLVSGTILLLIFNNVLTLTLTLLTWAFYSFFYTKILKFAGTQNIVIGGIAGAMPPLLGWTAITNSIDALPLLMVLIIFFWRRPHFWALSINRKEDYIAAKIPMMPVIKGTEYTKLQIALYSVLLAVTSIFPFATGYLGGFYFISALILNAAFIALAVALIFDKSNRLALPLFLYSIVFLTILFICMALDKLIPIQL